MDWTLVRRPRRIRAGGTLPRLRRAARPPGSGDPDRRPVALLAAENARRERAYTSFEDAIDRRFEESQLHRAPRALLEAELRDHLVASGDRLWRYRYSQAAVVAAYGEMASAPPPFERVRVPTLLVLGEDSYIPYDHLLDAHVAALGERLQVVRVPGGHTVLWDALDETFDAVESFLTS